MIEKILHVLGQSGHFYRIVSEGYCVPKEGHKLIIEVKGILPREYQIDIQALGFEIMFVSTTGDMYFIQ